MARTNTYLNFMGKTEEAFNFYRVVFGTELAMPIQRMSDVPGSTTPTCRYFTRSWMQAALASSRGSQLGVQLAVEQDGRD